VFHVSLLTVRLGSRKSCLCVRVYYQKHHVNEKNLHERKIKN
jgi:hypothetical protein